MESSWYVTKMHCSSKNSWRAFFLRELGTQYQSQKSKDLDRNKLYIKHRTASEPATNYFIWMTQKL